MVWMSTLHLQKMSWTITSAKCNLFTKIKIANKLDDKCLKFSKAKRGIFIAVILMCGIKDLLVLFGDQPNPPYLLIFD